MSNLQRRNFLKIAGASGAALAASSLLQPTVRKARAQSGVQAGRVFVVQSGPVTLHTYVAPDASVSVTSHIIETANQLVLVDTQLLPPFAQEVAAYVASLGKPLERIYLSHEHPDHWYGAENFAAPFLSTATIAANVQAFIDSGGVEQQGEELLGPDNVPSAPIAPLGDVVAGSETIDGVTFALDVIAAAEAPEQLLIKLPEAGIVIAQDLIYSATHAFPLPADRDGWLAALTALGDLSADGYTILGAGHGYLSGIGVVDEVADYLSFQADVIATSSSADEANARLVAEYPHYGGQFILTFLGAVFPE